MAKAQQKNVAFFYQAKKKKESKDTGTDFINKFPEQADPNFGIETKGDLTKTVNIAIDKNILPPLTEAEIKKKIKKGLKVTEFSEEIKKANNQFKDLGLEIKTGEEIIDEYKNKLESSDWQTDGLINDTKSYLDKFAHIDFYSVENGKTLFYDFDKSKRALDLPETFITNYEALESRLDKILKVLPNQFYLFYNNKFQSVFLIIYTPGIMKEIYRDEIQITPESVYTTSYIKEIASEAVLKWSKFLTEKEKLDQELGISEDKNGQMQIDIPDQPKTFIQTSFMPHKKGAVITLFVPDEKNFKQEEKEIPLLISKSPRFGNADSCLVIKGIELTRNNLEMILENYDKLLEMY